MVAHLLRLKLTLLRNMFRRSRAQAIGAILGILYFGFVVVAAAVGVAALRTSLPDARLYVPLGGALLMLGWALLPVLAFGSDPTLDPVRFATFAIPHRQLAVGLVVAALVGLPAIATMIVVAGTLVTWSVSPAAAAVALVSAAAGVLTCVALSRWVSSLASTAMTSRRGRDVTALVGVAVLVILGPVMALLESAGGRLEAIMPTVGTVAGWTPLGWIWAAPADVAVGLVGLGVLRLALGLALLALLAALWTRAVRREVESPRAASLPDSGAAHEGLGVFGRLPDTQTGAVAGQVITYWRRDPRYQVGLLMAPLTPLFLLLPRLTGGPEWPSLLMGPLIAFMLGWSEHNSLAYESTAFWLHVAAGTHGRSDRLARLVPTMALSAVLVPAYCVLGVWLGDRFDLLPAVVGLSVALLGSGYGLSSIMSVVLPYPVPKPGESPFSAPPGATGTRLLGQTVSSLGSMLLTAPVLLVAWLAWQGQGWAVWATAVAGLVLGPVLLVAGVRLGGRLYDRRAPELLAELVNE